jgi:quercetin dioxygenase-like cupin family protein
MAASIFTRRDLFVAVGLSFIVGAGLSLAATTAKPVMHSSIFNWADLTVVKTKTGERRTVFDNPTLALANLECHISTLNPGEFAHPPHRHPDEELIILKEGTLAAFQVDHTNIVKTGGIIFEASNELHNMQNVGTTPATYYVFRIMPRDLVPAR